MDALQQMLDAQSGAGSQPDPLQNMLMQQTKAVPATAQQTAESPEIPFGQSMNAAISDIPHQLGLTARHIIEGGGSTLNLLASPVRAGLNYILPKKAPSLSGLVTGDAPQDAVPAIDFQGLADKLGLPQPKNALERVVGDASRTLVGGAGVLGIAGKAASATTGTAQTIAKLLAANPAQQLVSAGSAGGAGGYVRETGGDETSQLIASLAAGVAAPFAMNKASQIGQASKNLINGFASKPQNTQIDMQINNAIQSSGMKMSDLPSHVQAGIRDDVAQALKSNIPLSPDAVRRLADYRLTGATPTAATLTLDPAMISQQKNLAKLGINSKDAGAQQLGQVENTNNRQLIAGLNDLGASTADSALAGGEKVMGALSDRNDLAKALINRRYDLARATNGRSAALDPHAFTNQANNALDESLLGGKLPSDVRNLLNKTSTGKMPLTVDTAEQFKTRIGDLQRSTTDMAERKALGLVRQSLDNTPLLDGQGQPAIDAFNRARSLNKAWMGIVEKTPALQAVRDGIEPDKFVQQFIVGNGGKSNLADLQALRSSIKSNPDAMTAVKTQIAAHLKKAALNGAADEVGNLSQSAYNKALNGIGDEKLSLFFPKEDIQQLKAIGRVSSYEQFQPKGSAVNNSNTAGTALANILDRIGGSPLLSKIPFGNTVSQPIQNISIGIRSKKALDTKNALLANALKAEKKPAGLLLSPAALLSTDDRKKSLLPRP